jgi:hypothetical protein
VLEQGESLAGEGEPAAAVEQEPPEAGQRGLAGPDGLDQLVPEGLEPGVEEAFLDGEVVEHRCLGDLGRP